MNELEDLSHHINDRISSIHHMLDLSGLEVPQRRRLGQELDALERLLEEFERCVSQQRDQLKLLKELQQSFQKDLQDVQHMKDNIPAHMPRSKKTQTSDEAAPKPNEARDVPAVQPENVRKTKKGFIREIEFITTPEFEGIPQYMKGRVSYQQLNAAVQSINTAVAGKYKILHQSVKTLGNHGRKLQQRFKDEETKDTKGHFFVVEEDLREFTQTKADKRFQGILNMLRHCQRLRELRGGGITRYLLL